jgi:YD repeat-containing protein
VRVRVAGTEFVQSFAPQPNLDYTYTWDGVDAYAREVQGSAAAAVEVAYVYAGVYTAPTARMVISLPFGVSGPPTATASFGFSSPAVVAVNANGPIATRDELRVERTWETQVTQRDLRGEGLGGWSVDAHHTYDPVGQTLLLGDGSRRTLETSFATIEALTANAPDTICPAEGTPGADACLETPGALAAAPDGSVYVGDGCSIRRVAGNGDISRIAGRRDACAFAGDGGLAQDGRLTWPHALAVAPDGDLYVLDGLYNALPNNVGRRVRRISQDGVIETVAGNGLFGYNGDGMAATQASFTNPNALVVDATGVLYIADTGANRVRRVGLNGEITTVAGTGQNVFNGDGLAATATALYAPYDVAVGAEGSLYIADTLHHRVRRVRPDGLMETVAGNGGDEYNGDGLPATQTALPAPWRLEIDAAGRLLIASGGWVWYYTSRLVMLADGVLATVAGGEEMIIGGDIVGMPAAAVDLSDLYDVAATAEGGFALTFRGDARLFGVKQTLPAFDGNGIRLPSPDGREVYEFDATGRHLRTRDALTGAVRLSFTYDEAGRLASITDGDGGVTTFVRNGAGELTAIVAPEGQQTTVTLDANGYVAGLTDPAGATQRFTTSDKGLITAATDARDNVSTYRYATDGRVASNQNGIGGGHGFSLEAVGAGRVVTVTDALGNATRHTVTREATGTQMRSATTADGA